MVICNIYGWQGKNFKNLDCGYGRVCKCALRPNCKSQPRHRSIYKYITENDDLDIFEYIEKNNSKVIALTERSGLFVKDDKVKAVGHEPAYVFEDGKKREVKPLLSI